MVAALGKRGVWLAVCGSALLGATTTLANIEGPVVGFHRAALAAGANEVLITLAPLPVEVAGQLVAPLVAEDFGRQLAVDATVELVEGEAPAEPFVEYGQVYRVTVREDQELVLIGLAVWEEARP